MHIALYFLFELLLYYSNLHLFLPRFPPNSFRSFFLFLLLMLSPPISFSFFHGFNFCVLSFVFSHSLSYSFSTPIPFSTSPQAWQGTGAQTVKPILLWCGWCLWWVVVMVGEVASLCLGLGACILYIYCSRVEWISTVCKFWNENQYNFSSSIKKFF